MRLVSYCKTNDLVVCRQAFNASKLRNLQVKLLERQRCLILLFKLKIEKNA